MICLATIVGLLQNISVVYPLSPQRYHRHHQTTTIINTYTTAGILRSRCRQRHRHHDDDQMVRYQTMLCLSDPDGDHDQSPDNATTQGTTTKIVDAEVGEEEMDDFGDGGDDNDDIIDVDDDGVDELIQQSDEISRKNDLKSEYDASRILEEEEIGADDDHEGESVSSSSSPSSSISILPSPSTTKNIKIPSDTAWVERATRVLLSARLASDVGEWTKKEIVLWEKAFFAWCKRVSNVGYRPAYMQERLIQRLIEEQEAGNSLAWTVDMNDVYYQLIRTWQRSGGRGTPRRCEDILDAMQDLYGSGDPRFENLKPEIAAWNQVILAYSRSRTNDAPNQAVRVLLKLQKLFEDRKTDVVPDQQSYASILKAHASLGGQDAPKRVLEVLNRMSTAADEGYSSIRLNANCHNVYMQSLTDSLDLYEADISAIVRAAELHFKKMAESTDPNCQPDLWTHNIFLNLLSRSGHRDSADRAEALVQRMEDMGWTPSCLSYNCLIAAYTSSPKKDKADRACKVLERMKRMARKHPECSPDRVTYHSVMNVCAKTTNPRTLSIPDQLMKEMNERYEQTKDPMLKPTIMSWNICFDAWAKSNEEDATQRIWQQIEALEKMSDKGDVEVRPNQYSYNIYLQSVAKQRRPWSADEAERILKFLKEKSMEPSREELQPDVLTFTNVLHAIALSEAEDGFQRAYTILQEMEEGDMDVRPNVYTYNVIINAVAKSKILGKAKISIQLLRRMKEVSIVPITITLNNILNACAYSDRGYENRREILDIALVILKEAQNTCGANYITYGTALRVIRFFADDYMERWQLIRRVFRECLRDGQFSPSIMKHVRGKGLTVTHFDLLVKEATDPETGEWKKEYMKNSKRTHSPSIYRSDSPRHL